MLEKICDNLTWDCMPLWRDRDRVNFVVCFVELKFFQMMWWSLRNRDLDIYIYYDFFFFFFYDIWYFNGDVILLHLSCHARSTVTDGIGTLQAHVMRFAFRSFIFDTSIVDIWQLKLLRVSLSLSLSVSLSV